MKMKESLTRHIADILTSLQLGDISFDVYECQVDTLPSWTNQIALTRDFLVCSDSNLDMDKLQHFLRKDIYQLDNAVYWFEAFDANTCFVCPYVWTPGYVL
ncbi:MAG: hypothetical protein LBC40_00240, partial [Dysgonamonadaceae bacterium]|nr:hypothetical protein [Dysgonamonadaceae bacterium]